MKNRPKEIIIPRDIELPIKKREIKTIKELDEQNFVEQWQVIIISWNVVLSIKKHV